MKKVFLSIALAAIAMVGMAQNEQDAYRYGQDELYGTARFTALSGSLGAFGADFSALSVNPATIGIYKRTEITFTPTLGFTKAESKYNQETSYADKYAFTVGNLGIVSAFNIANGTQWKMWQLSFGYNQLANYNTKSLVKGSNEGKTSFIDFLAPQLNGNDYNSLGYGTTLGDIIYYHYLVDTVPGTTDQYESINMDELNQKQMQTSKGSKGEYVFSGGANYNDKLFLGVTLGVPHFNYSRTRIYTEGPNINYDSLIFNDYFRDRGTGINLKLGLIYQPTSFMRIGAAFHTPTLYSKVKSTYEQTLQMDNVEGVDTFDYLFDYSVGTYNYRLITPYKFTANVAFMFLQYGFINVDYEMVNYSTARLDSYDDDYEFEVENNNIKEYYKTTHTIKAGLEFVINPVALRLGYSYMTNPFADAVGKNGARHNISAGIGFKTKCFFMDFAYAYRIYKDESIFYNAPQVNSYQQNFRNQSFVLTLGWKLGAL